MSLYVTELRRLFKRRVTRLMLVLLMFGLALITVSIGYRSHTVGPAQVAAAEAQIELQFQEQLRHHEQTMRDCEAAKARGEDVTERFGPDCGASYVPTRDQYETRWYLPYQFEFSTEFQDYISVFSGIVALFAFVIGASYIGAEWSSGGMANLLLWRPKRITVLLTKLGALLSGVLATSLLLGGLWTGAFWLIAKYRGVPGKMTPGVWESLALSGARGIGLVLLLAAVAFGLASLGRHSAMALGVAVGVGVVGEVGLRIALEIAKVRFSGRYLPSTYVTAWFQKEWTLLDFRTCEFAQGMCKPGEMIITWQHSGLLFAVGTVVVLGAAIWAIRRRDIA